MLVPVLVSLFWAVCSTVFIQRWFWKGLIKRKTLIGDENNRGWNINEENTLKAHIILQITFGCITFFVSLIFYLKNTDYNFYYSILPILIVLFFQGISVNIGFNKNKKLKTAILIAIAVMFAEIDTFDFSKNQEKVPLEINIEEHKANKEQKILSSSVVRNLFKATWVSAPVYSNGKFVYTITDSPNGDGVVIIDENDGKTAKFILCNYPLEIESVFPQKYPSDKIKSLNIVVSDDNIPFGKYAFFSETTTLFGEPILKYALQNMINGEITEYTDENLPEFAK